jgi:hypothetical protein
MLDHVFLDAVSTLRAAFDEVLLQRQSSEDRLAVDILLGDLVWETSYSLPGEGDPPRVRADVTLDWPTWSQASWRSRAAGESDEEPPEIGIEVVLRVQRLARRPDVDSVLAVLPKESSRIGAEVLERSGPVIEESWEDDVRSPRFAVEVAYDGTYRMADDAVLDTREVSGELAALGRWVASTLVRLGDLRLDYLPPDEEEK